VQKRVEAERELGKEQKVLQNFELLSKSIDSEIVLLHSIGLSSARKEVERAKQRLARAKELVRLRIKVIRARRNANGLLLFAH
jgi:hypothetical protein